MPWPAWLSWLSIVPQIKRMLVQFPVRAHGLCAWSLGGVHEKGNQSIPSRISQVSVMWFKETTIETLGKRLRSRKERGFFCLAAKKVYYPYLCFLGSWLA